ncbi:sulfite exporter TauE/SafE family protein [Streptomyces albidoflavus]|uniref:sulfite exporter TauE/SafE family protein n=1 Tax=Streptomyces TaxID=1883 RepID=UPI001EE43717|nr:sulfite exporter TauE/SafE family protein [Streptomyces sp. T7(2022)]MCG5123032.1 sulfite exporter TauE/SafE family protein [Streptomyces sp. T7(2022)]
MTLWEAVAVLLAGFAGGALNTAVGSGTLVTFPVLLATGLPPVTATVSNALGLIPGSVSGAYAYRRELAGQRRMLIPLCASAAAGGLVGAGLLMVLPPGVFATVVPVLVGLALLLIAVQPLLTRALRGRLTRPGGGLPLRIGLGLASVYGGYFSAGQGILYVALSGALLEAPLQRINALKNVLVAQVNAVAAGFFLIAADIDWPAALLIAAGATAGAPVGARAAQRLRPVALRVLILTVGTAGLLHMTLG